MSDRPEPAEPFSPARLGFDPERLRAKYRVERDRRLRPEGAAQYIPATGKFGYYVHDPYVESDGHRAPVTGEVNAVIVGGGFGGLLAGARLREAGIGSIRIIEKSGDVGGTWYWNRYPGVRCDIESYVYLPLLEEIGRLPSEKYSTGAEIRGHAQAIAEAFDLYRGALFQTEVTELSWDEPSARWTVGTNRYDLLTARYVVIATGIFSRPQLPGVPGIDTFRGHTFHTSRWDYAYTAGDQSGGMHKLADKRVAVIGTGASGVQCVPMLAQDAAHLYVFQRTPSTVDTRSNRTTDPDWASALPPGWHRRRRDNFLTLVSGGWPGEDLVGDHWADLNRFLRAELAEFDQSRLTPELMATAMEIADFRKMNQLRDRIDQTVDDRATAEALKPWYRHICKRPAFSDDYLPAFNRPNVTLVDTRGKGVERITEHGIIAGGITYPVDCIVFATGFQVGGAHPAFSGPPIVGRGRVSLREYWRDGIRTLHGVTSHGFPNLFCLGIAQNPTAVNFTHILDELATHVAAIIQQAGKQSARYVEPSVTAEQNWVDLIVTLSERASGADVVLAECTPGYYNNEGKPRTPQEGFTGSPLAFHELLRTWRAENGYSDVLVP